MAAVNAQSVEDFADRIVYRYPGGRYEQALTTMSGAFSVGLKLLANTDINRSYIIPTSGVQARFFKVEYVAIAAAQVAETTIGNTLIPIQFSKISIPTLNYDGKSQQTEFYDTKFENIIPASYLRAINIGNISIEPVLDYGTMQWTGLSGVQFNIGGATTGLVAIVHPTVTFYKK